MTSRRLLAALRRAGRRRYLEATTDRLRAIFRAPRMRQPPLVEDALGAQAKALVLQLDAARNRFRNARALKTYAGAAPLTRTFGKSTVAQHRKVKNQRLAAVGFLWAYAAIATSGPRAHYDHRRTIGDRHSSALRNTFNRLLGYLFHCLQTRQLYELNIAFQPRLAATT
ncbi:transposase [Spirillospora sp. NBC_00431]